MGSLRLKQLLQTVDHRPERHGFVCRIGVMPQVQIDRSTAFTQAMLDQGSYRNRLAAGAIDHAMEITLVQDRREVTGSGPDRQKVTQLFARRHVE